MNPEYKAIYMGIPVRLRDDNDICPDCGQCGVEGIGPMAWILFSLFALGLPFNGVFYVYEGSYLKALWRWINTTEEEDQDG